MKTFINTVFIFLLLFFISFPVFAQDNHTAREEKEGKIIWSKLQTKEITCDTLSEEDFERLGEYYMGQMAGDSHEAMNNMMIQMMSEQGEKQMHAVMGKRLSGCDTTAEFSNQVGGFMPMMWMMGGGGNSMMGYGNMTGWGGFGFLIALFWIVILVDLILLGVWLWKKIQKTK